MKLPHVLLSFTTKGKFLVWDGAVLCELENAVKRAAAETLAKCKTRFVFVFYSEDYAARAC